MTHPSQQSECMHQWREHFRDAASLHSDAFDVRHFRRINRRVDRIRATRDAQQTPLTPGSTSRFCAQQLLTWRPQRSMPGRPTRAHPIAGSMPASSWQPPRRSTRNTSLPHSPKSPEPLLRTRTVCQISWRVSTTPASPLVPACMSVGPCASCENRMATAAKTASSPSASGRVGSLSGAGASSAGASASGWTGSSSGASASSADCGECPRLFGGLWGVSGSWQCLWWRASCRAKSVRMAINGRCEQAAAKATCRQRVFTLQSAPARIRGALRTAMRTGLRLAVHPVAPEDAQRGWKLFCLAPRMFPFRSPGESRIPSAELERRCELFRAGHWPDLLRQSASAAAVPPSPRRGDPSDAQRARRAAALVRLGELSAAGHALTAQPLAAGSSDTLAELRDPARRPPRSVRPSARTCASARPS